MPISAAKLMRQHGINVQAAGDDLEGAHRRGVKDIKLTPTLVASAVKELQIHDLADYLHGREVMSAGRLSSEFPAEKAAEIFTTVLERVDPAWEKKQAIVYKDDQVVVVERPAAEVAGQLHQALEHLRAEKAAKTKKEAPAAKEPKAPRAPKTVKEPKAPAADKPKRAPRKPKAEG